MEYPCRKCEIEYCYSNCNKFNEWLEIAEEALERQEPKRAEVIPEDDDFVYVRYECPMCEHILGYGNLKPFGKKKYCPNCGQRLEN